MKIVRWLAAFRFRGPVTPRRIVASLEWECDEGLAHERAAEPLWRGQTAMGWRSAGVGLVYEAADVSRAFGRDAWSEPTGSGRLTRCRAGRLRAWRDVDAFARAWTRDGGHGGDPYAHGEVWLRRGAAPVALALLDGRRDDVTAAAKAWADARGLRVMAIRRVA